MPVLMSGNGVLKQGLQTLYEGKYTLITSGPPNPPILLRGPGGPALLTGSGEQAGLSGTFEVYSIRVDQLIEAYRSRRLASPAFLTLDDGREVKVHLTLEQKDYDAQNGIARFGLVFEPGSLEALLRQPDPQEKKVFATVVKRGW